MYGMVFYFFTMRLLITCTLTLLLSILTPTTSNPSHAISSHKAPNPSTPTAQALAWNQRDAALHSYIATSIPAVLEHTGSEAFDAHLKGVQSVLRWWGAEEYLCSAGLFHSIYDTEGFQGFSLPLSERHVIRELIGEKAEKLCWIFCMVDRSTVDETVFNWTINDSKTDRIGSEQLYTFRARPELGRFEIILDKNEWIDFIELTLADWLEQVQGAAETPSSLFLWKEGEAYAYRRTAYAKMAEILSYERPERLAKKVNAAMKDVYGTESAATRHLVQLRTPPMSDAAKSALDALRSNGEEIPLNFAPLPQTKSDEL
eukprot:CCRYP_014027-RB/>CCRYP_014027-RB protein AED:0.29 eAED:0.29 QI:0/0.83/0.71/1/0.5/0.14/7/4542/315